MLAVLDGKIAADVKLLPAPLFARELVVEPLVAVLILSATLAVPLLLPLIDRAVLGATLLAVVVALISLVGAGTLTTVAEVTGLATIPALLTRLWKQDTESRPRGNMYCNTLGSSRTKSMHRLN